MDLGLKGKVAIVTASSRGIGRAAAEILAAEGARTTMFARTAADVMTAADQIRERTGTEVLAVPADLTKAEDIQRIVDRTVEAYGTVNILVNNAGGPPPGTFDGVGEAEWQTAFELTLLTVVRMTRAVLPFMRLAGGGVIINLQSTSVKVPLDNLILSNSIRAGLIGLAPPRSRRTRAAPRIFPSWRLRWRRAARPCSSRRRATRASSATCAPTRGCPCCSTPAGSATATTPVPRRSPSSAGPACCGPAPPRGGRAGGPCTPSTRPSRRFSKRRRPSWCAWRSRRPSTSAASSG